MPDASPPPTRHFRTPARRALGLVFALLAAACSPTFDWRDVALPDTGVHAQLPCRPGRFERSVLLGGHLVSWFMLSCEARGVTYGLGSADLVDATRVEPALETLLATATRNVASAEVRREALTLERITPFVGNVSARIHGEAQDGRKRDESIRVFAIGTRVFQVSAIAEHLDDEALQPFLQGLRLEATPTGGGGNAGDVPGRAR